MSVSRLRVTARGAVQGVGFRPFVWRLARELRLAGWVKNTAQGVLVEVEGGRENLEDFLARLQTEKPAQSIIQHLEHSFLAPSGFHTFDILESDETLEKTTLVLPDLAVCPQCCSEIFDRNDRRFLYPFTNCTQCGPRFSIIGALPYDRANTTMKAFAMCTDCRREYEDPGDRRFHAQPNACGRCGPHVEFWDADGRCLHERERAMMEAAAALRRGMIVAVKGIGGFHLCVDAANEEGVRRLRQRKRRAQKPLALMFPSLEAIRRYCELTALEEEILTSRAAPIVLAKRKQVAALAESVAPDNPYLGVMLPFSPLHHILMREAATPLVATSGNISEEPICTDGQEALARLKGVADCFLVHNRPIVRPVDDSLARVVAGRMMVLRRARGFAPLPVEVPLPSGNVLALGGHLKNTVALKIGSNVFISQHLGDLETPRSRQAFEQAITSFKELYQPKIDLAACDRHPDYASTAKARRMPWPVEPVQHHHAHIVSCMAENGITGEVLGLAWDGTGFGPDNSVWGGEFLAADFRHFRRVGHFRPFRLLGGDKAVGEPRRAALSLLYELDPDPPKAFKDLATLRAFDEQQLRILSRMRAKGLNSPLTSSVGRLFDAFASLLDLAQTVNFEGQAAMALEYLCDGKEMPDHYKMDIADENGVLVIDWRPMLAAAVADIRGGLARGVLAQKFHNSLVEAALEVVLKTGLKDVVLGGGCFQNKYLCERMIGRLRQADLRPSWHRQVPPNDGGISLGQAVTAAATYATYATYLLQNK
ncbi:MAG: carbamoyltransferase HypF [Candidatus Omnitrophica bacterium]|nr:carbamoyltransferase HypF [Candidatus Omnitrophota bacterium]